MKFFLACLLAVAADCLAVLGLSDAGAVVMAFSVGLMAEDWFTWYADTCRTIALATVWW